MDELRKNIASRQINNVLNILNGPFITSMYVLAIY